MIKIRNKRIALLLVMAMLATMFIGIGTASASDWMDVNSGYRFVAAGETDQAVGDIEVILDSSAPTADQMVVKAIIQTADVTWSANGTNELTLTTGFTGIMDGDGKYTFDGTNNLIDVGDDVTGSITADVRFYALNNDGEYLWDETETQTIAKVDTGATSVSVAAKKALEQGVDEQLASAITVKEAGPTAFDDPEEVTFSIVTSGVTWANYGTSIGVSENDYTDKKLVVEFGTNEALAEKLVLTPYLTVSPAVKDGTEVQIKVSGDEITSTTVVVGVVTSGDVAVTVKNADEDFVYRGQAATFDDVSVKLNPGGKLDTYLHHNDWFSVTLPQGVKWQYEPMVTDGSNVEFQGFYDQGSTAWFNIEYRSDETIKLTDFAVVADSNAVVGDLEITFDGAVEGTYKIGSIENAFTVETVPFALTSAVTGIQAADIIITETADGALKPYGDSDYGYYDYKDNWHEYSDFDITLPAGVTFVGTPEIDVTDGDLEIDWVSDWSEDFRSFAFDVDDTSSQASTITISGLEFSVLSQPGLGDLKASIGAEYNIASNKALETLVIGAVATNPTAVYVIGAPTFTVNGAVQSVVTPSYIKNGRTYLAIRDIASGLGIDPMNVLWDAAASKVTLIKGTKIVQVTIGSNVMNINGVAVTMDVAPEISNGRTMLPAAFIAQAFGATASWDAATQTVTIK